MQITECSLQAGVPRVLDWSANVSLLLDGVSVEHLSQRIYQWADSPYFEPLYLRSRWSGVLDLSPCLIRIGSRSDPVLKQFLAHVDEEWGCLLCSDRPWREQVDHLRWLTTVTEPSGQEFLLRMADPVVMQCLLAGAEQHRRPTLFGPFTQAFTADSSVGHWRLSQRPGDAHPPQYDSPYRLSREETERLGDVTFRSEILRVSLYLHMKYPAFRASDDSVQRWAFAQQLVIQAYQRGFCDDLRLEQYAEIHALLGEHVLQEHPDINQLLSKGSPATANPRMTQALNIARARAHHFSGNQG